MPFPANWLEELVVEWLDLDGFAITTSVVVPAGPGGRWVPDVVGAKLQDDGRLVIRHCEATLAPAQNPKKTAERLKHKFSEPVERKVREYFSHIFGEAANDKERTKYEKWLIIALDNASVRRELERCTPEVEVQS